MTQRIEPGHYKIGEDKHDPDRKGYYSETIFGVIRGDVANKTNSGGFAGQYGFKASKWYAYAWEKTTVQPSLDFSPTAPQKAFNRHFSEIDIIQKEFDSKKAAVEECTSNWSYQLSK